MYVYFIGVRVGPRISTQQKAISTETVCACQLIFKECTKCFKMSLLPDEMEAHVNLDVLAISSYLTFISNLTTTIISNLTTISEQVEYPPPYITFTISLIS